VLARGEHAGHDALDDVAHETARQIATGHGVDGSVDRAARVMAKDDDQRDAEDADPELHRPQDAGVDGVARGADDEEIA